MISKILVAAGILYNNKNDIYIFKRASTLPILPNYYEFAGGKLEPGETSKTALKRELKEELSIEIDEENINSFEDNIVENEKYKVTFFKICKWKNEIKLNKNEIQNINDLLETNKVICKYI